MKWGISNSEIIKAVDAKYSGGAVKQMAFGKGLFGKRKKKEDKEEEKKSAHRAMPSSSQLHDPILSAVQESQPYEVTNEATTMTVSPSGALRDVFGNPITRPDISNPARSRDERPLDTIRGFEYATTGDERLRENYESNQLGFRPRTNFSSMPQYDQNPYENNAVIWGDPNAEYDQKEHAKYHPQNTVPPQPKKKKKKSIIPFRKRKNSD